MEIRFLIKYGLYTVILILLQILLFNYVSLGVGLVPFVYVLVILLLPNDIDNWMLLIFSFILGLLIDIFSDTMALNAASVLFMAVFRPLVIKLLAPDEGFVPDTLPSIKTFKVGKFVIYISVLVFVYQLVYHILDIFNISKIGIVLLKTIINTFQTVSFMIIIHLLLLKNK